VKISDAPVQIRSHWPLAIIAVIGAAFIFTNLGAGYLWADEGDTAVLASNILKFGVPKAWDGVTFIDSDFGARENDQLVMVSSPWVQYYVTAASFFAFGQNTFAARFPFALAGWMSILLVYFIVWQITTNRWAALCTAVLLVMSAQFLLYSRQSRYYALSMLFTCLLIWTFLQMKSLRNTVLFGLLAILLFHIHPIGIVPVGVLAILTLLHRPFATQRRSLWLALPGVIAFTIPWFALARTGYTENAALVPSIGDFFARLAQYSIECASVTPLVGIVVLSLVLLFHRRQGFGFLSSREWDFLLVIFAVILSFGVAMALTQRSAALWVTGTRYTSAIIPLVAMAAGILIAKIAHQRAVVWMSILLVFAFTNLGQITPWVLWADKNPNPENKIVAVHVPQRLMDGLIATGPLLFVRDLFRANPGTVTAACEFLRKNAGPGDVVITNYESEPLYFHTRLPQGMKIMKQDSIYEIAKRRHLPDYAFGVDQARWIVWRFNWDDYLGIRWADVEHRLLSEGAKISDVAQLEETAWENRENIHFHRFAGGRYLFPQDKDLAPAHIFRVDWPAGL
jgi:4-amino-4-deoxy-L-arabinose transferase-like glycosyltransferase